MRVSEGNISKTYLAEVHLVKDHLIGVADAPESCNESENGDDGEGELVVPFSGCSLLGLLLQLVEDAIEILLFHSRSRGTFLVRFDGSLANTAHRRGHFERGGRGGEGGLDGAVVDSAT